MSRWFVVTLLLATGCRSLLGLDDSTPRGSGGDDDGSPHPDAPLCWGSEPSVCLAAEPTGRLDLGGDIDTSTSEHCVAHDPVTPDDVCVIAARQVHIVGVTSFVGTRAVVVIAADTLSIENVLDIASHTNARIATAAAGSRIDTTDCTFAASPEAHTAGAGGSHAGFGGDGGDSRDNNDTKVGEGGMHGPLPSKVGLIGGCRGQSGFAAADHFGDGGYGGGAIELVAGAAITITDAGHVDASGGAGVGGQCKNNGPCDAQSDARGGGGGGAGGRIILDAPAISNGGSMFADGGGGGGGASHGKDGFDGHDPDGTAAALGGFDPDDDSTRAGPGGGGSHGSAADGVIGGDGTQMSAAFLPGAGGGGGGGAGVIRVHGTTVVTGAGSISPAPSFP